MSIAYLISVFVHIVSASFWIGGMLFLPLVLLPSIRKHPDRILLLHKTGIKFRFYGWIALITLFITGGLNMHFRGLPFTWEFFTDSNFGELLYIKLMIFIVMLLIVGIHDFFIGEKAIEQMQDTENGKLKLIARWSGRINLLLALAVAFLGIALSRGGF